MTAQELRIGNWIRKTDGRGNFQVDPEILCAIAHTPPKEMEEEFIPITSEWMVDFGFKKNPDYPHLWFLKDFRFNLNSFTVKILRSCDKAGESQRHECGYPVLTDMISCGYVHQLQNLYFALTGEELEVKSE